MKRIALDKKDKKIKQFIHALGANVHGSLLEIDGIPVLRTLPVKNEVVDRSRLRAAIRKRRDASRRLMHEWQAVDREMWERIPNGKE